MGSSKKRGAKDSTAEHARRILALYPQIYLACHARHVRARSSEAALSASDGSLLSHLSEIEPISPRELAKHLGITAGTLSAAVERLAGLGYLRKDRRGDDRRRVDLRLSPRGARAMEASSVLDVARVQKVLARLEPGERAAAVEGLAVLARAARETTAALSAERSWVKRRSREWLAHSERKESGT